MNNLNNRIRIKLTDEGIKILSERSLQYLLRKISYGMVLEISIWEFAQIFGKYLYLGNPRLPCEMWFEYKGDSE